MLVIYWFVLLFIIYLIAISHVYFFLLSEVEGKGEESRLITHILTNYSRFGRPIEDINLPVNVSISFYLTQLMSLASTCYVDESDATVRLFLIYDCLFIIVHMQFRRVVSVSICLHVRLESIDIRLLTEMNVPIGKSLFCKYVILGKYWLNLLTVLLTVLHAIYMYLGYVKT